MVNQAPIREPAGANWSPAWQNWYSQVVMTLKGLTTGVSGLTTGVSTLQTSVTALQLGKADDSAVVHKTGDETVAGVKTFSSYPVVPTPLTADNSVKAVNSAWVRAQGYGQGTITGVVANRVVVVGFDAGTGYTTTYGLEVTGSSIRLVETRTYNP